jgi:hypothetical protein
MADITVGQRLVQTLNESLAQNVEWDAGERVVLTLIEQSADRVEVPKTLLDAAAGCCSLLVQTHAPVSAPANGPRDQPNRGLKMPRRKTTRAQDRAKRIDAERTRNLETARESRKLLRRRLFPIPTATPRGRRHGAVSTAVRSTANRRYNQSYGEATATRRHSPGTPVSS